MPDKVSFSKKATRLSMPFPPDWLESIAATVGAVSLTSFFFATLVKFGREQLAKARKATADKEVQQLRLTLATEGPFQQVLSTSTAQGPAGIAEGPASIAQLRQQISAIEQKVQNHRNEIVEVRKIDPVLEATIKASIDNLTKRIEFLEKTRLEKWDVAIVIFQILSGLGVILGGAFAILKYLHP